MTEPRATLRRRRRTFDPRLLIGVVLVVASIAGVVGIVAATDRRVTVYAAAGTLAPGDAVRFSELIAKQVSFDDARALYLTAADVGVGDLVATTVVRRGELVPRSAVGSAIGSRSTSLVLRLTGEVSESVVEGALVDVWSSPLSAGDGDIPQSSGFGPPVVIVSDATVVRVLADDGLVSAADGRAVEVLVPKSRIARLLHAVANGDALAVVPAGIPLGSR